MTSPGQKPPFITSRRRALSGLAGLALTAADRPDATARVSVAAFGALPGVSDAGPGVRAAIESLGKRPGSTLHFPRGTYRFAAHDGVAMLFDDMDHVTIEGEAATLLFNGAAAPLLMRRCRAPSIKGLTFDWERPPFSQGEITDVGPGGYALTLRIDPDFPVNGTEKIRQLGTYDRRTRAMTWHGIDDGGSVAQVSLTGSQLLHITLKRPVPFKAGDTVVARHGGGPHVVELRSCQDFSIRDLAIYAGPSMAIALGGCEGGSVQGVRVEQKPGSGRLMSTNADGLHCTSCSGDLEITDCTFGGMGDDGINVTGMYLAVETGRDQRMLTLSSGHPAPAPLYAAPLIGDHLLLVSGLTLKPLAEVQVQNMDRGDDGKWSIQLPGDHPALTGEPVFAIDLKAKTQLLVSRCNFPGNRARGVLAHSDAIIEHCTFEHQSDSAILLAPDMYWHEGPAIERTVVRGNHMDTGNFLGRARATVWIGAFVSLNGHQGMATPEVVNRNVAVESNIFVQPSGPAVAAAATSDLRIEDNQIEQASPVVFTLDNVRNVKLRGNRCDPAAAIRVDPLSRNELTMSQNTGMSVT
jgi:hypothetical protein